MLAELLDAVVGVDTHRDTHQVEIALPNGVPIALTTISNDSSGYAELLAWIVDHAPGPRLAVSIEGTRSYGIGLARAAAAAGFWSATARMSSTGNDFAAPRWMSRYGTPGLMAAMAPICARNTAS